MDKKSMKYVSYILGVVTLLLGLNGLIGGNPVVWGEIDLLHVFAVVFVIYYFYSHKKMKA